MFKRLILSFFLTPCFLTLLAQEGQEKSPLSREYFVKLNMLGFLDPSTPSAQFSFEYRVSRRFGFEVTAGIPCYILKSLTNDSTHHTNFKYKVGFKSYIWKEGFIGAEFFGATVRYNRYNGHYATRQGNDYTFQEADIRKNISGLAFKAGALIPLSQDWYLEPATGFGLRSVHTSIRGANGEQPSDFNAGYISIPHAVAGYKITPHINMELKVAYRF
jgi:hypothetical protein